MNPHYRLARLDGDAIPGRIATRLASGRLREVLLEGGRLVDGQPFEAHNPSNIHLTNPGALLGCVPLGTGWLIVAEFV